MTLLGLIGLSRVFQRDRSLGIRFAIVLFFFPLAYYFSHPEHTTSGQSIRLSWCWQPWPSLEDQKNRRIAASFEWGLTSNH